MSEDSHTKWTRRIQAILTTVAGIGILGYLAITSEGELQMLVVGAIIGLVSSTSAYYFSAKDV